MKSLLPTTMTSRLVATSVALVAVVSLLVAISATLIMRSYLTGRLDDDLEQSLERAQTAVQGDLPDARRGPPPGDDFGGERVPLALGQGAGTLTALSDANGTRGSFITGDGRRRELSRSALEELLDVKTDGRARTVALPALGSYRVVADTVGGGTLIGGLPTGDVDQTIESLIWWSAVLTAGGLVVAGLAGRELVRCQLRPLREVAATAHEVTMLPLDTGEVGRTVRVPDELTDPATEVGSVGEALNRLLGHMEQALDARHESEQQVRQFLADASHELRTPLSTIQGYAELARRTGTDQSAKVESEAARMAALVEDMLLLARLDAGRPLEREPVDLRRLLAEAVDDARVVDGERTWRLDLPADAVTVTGDATRLHQAATNLLRNASRHTPAGTTVTGRLAVDDRVRLSVHDDGPGLDPDLVPVVFERFTRGDSSRTRASGGAGLGTSLVRAIAEAHGGTASVTSRPGSTTFTVDLPTG